ncbi:DUF3352 domain-containing protein [Tumidithrix elongata RA019]|uniref:DUF3352 domain-containing protein n=1 Tax=Tumidithrix elongata BACA0141 TaxID=2716417 RepID=A0AAW9PXI7_9CYAN|nr:DUF3352 domain-containing protein [Tumidithrix elongata RA019]
MSRSSKSNKPASKRQKSSAPLFVAIGAAVATVGAGAAVFFVWQKSQVPTGVIGTASAIPQEAQVVMAFNTTSEPWQKLVQFGTPDSQKLLSEGMEKSPLNSLLVQSKTDFSRDVQPWLKGHVITALIADPQKPNAPPATLVIAPTSDRAKSDLFLTKYRDALTQQGAKFTPKEYKEFKYYESPTRDPNNSVITADIGGRYVAIATSSALIQRTIDTYKGDLPSLAKKSSFATVFGAESKSNIAEPLVQIYLDGAIALEFIGSQTKLSLGEPIIAQSRRELDAITLTAGTQKEGLRFEVTTYLKDKGTTNNPQAQTAAGTVLNSLPQEAFLLVSGINLNQSWQSLVAQAKGNANSEQMLDQIRKSVKDATKLDLERDILKWMTGEFAIAAIPNNQGILANPGFGFVVLLQTSNDKDAQATFDKLDAAAKTSSSGLIPQGVDLKSKKLGDRDIVTWQVGNATMASHGSLGNNFVFWSMGDLADQFVPKPTKSLPESSSFQILTTGLPKTNGGYFYLNMTTALTIADRLLPPDIRSTPSFTQVRAVLDAIRGIAVTSTNINSRITRLDFLFTLKPTPGN